MLQAFGRVMMLPDLAHIALTTPSRVSPRLCVTPADRRFRVVSPNSASPSHEGQKKSQWSAC